MNIPDLVYYYVINDNLHYLDSYHHDDLHKLVYSKDHVHIVQIEKNKKIKNSFKYHKF